MKRLPGLLYLAFPSVLLFAQSSRPDLGLYRTPALGTPSFQRRFPPDLMSSSWTESRSGARLPRSFCIYPDADRKSLRVKRCDTAPQALRLASPFKAVPREVKPVHFRLGPVAP